MKGKYQPSPEEIRSAEAMVPEEERAKSEIRERNIVAIDELGGRIGTYLGWMNYFKEAEAKGLPKEVIEIYPRRHIKRLILDGEVKAASDFMRNRGPQLSEEELQPLLTEACASLMGRGRRDKAFRIMRSFSIGTEEERKRVGEQALEELLQGKFFVSAKKFAEELYGKGTLDYEEALQRVAAAEKEAARKRTWKLTKDNEGISSASLGPEATVADLFEALASDESTEETNLEDRFWSEIYDNFVPEIANVLLDAENNLELRDMKVVDFLKQQGISQKDASIFLPIRFSKTKKKKG